MARQDISVNPEYGELNLARNITSKIMYDFAMCSSIEGLDNDNFCYGEITVPPNFEQGYKKENGIYVRIPYIPKFKKLKIRFVFSGTEEFPEYLINRFDNQIWFDTQVNASEMISINHDFVFNLVIDNGKINVFSGFDTDFSISPSLNQNKAFLLKAFPGALYPYPTTGVGILDYMSGNIANSELADILQKQFEADGMTVNNASVDQETSIIYLDVSENG